MEPETMDLYKDRFENLLRITKKVTSCLNIGDMLEIIRDEVKVTIPQAREACMILMDPDAASYTRPLHCSVRPDQINCHPCERGKALIQMVLAEPAAFQCPLDGSARPEIDLTRTDPTIGGVALPIYYEEEPLAILKVVTEQGFLLKERDIVLLKDLVEVTANAINNAKKYSRMASEKLTLERILGHIRPFVPETVHRIVEKNPDAPALSRTELDVSILFLDVADYTRISESLTQDKVNFIIEKYFSSFLGVIYSKDGDVNETAGDGLMAIFQGEADLNALNAARAALEIRRRAVEINQELGNRFHPIVVNMGINSGIASVGMSRFEGGSGTRTTFTASGPVTNLASRLAAAAGEGDILVGPETARRIQDKMMLFFRGPMSFKNIRENVLVYSLVPPTQ